MYIFALAHKYKDKNYAASSGELTPHEIRRHNKGENTYTKTRRPVVLITYIAFSDKYKAINFEKYLKSGSGKAFAQKHLI